MVFASLPWYDLPEVREATEKFWNCLAANLRNRGFKQVPEKLNRELAFDQQWTSGRLLFSQACGYDVLLAYRNCLRLVLTPTYTVAGRRHGLYSSVLVVRRDARIEHTGELRGFRCVVNTPTSHSGMNVLRALFASAHQKGRFFSAVLHSGSHEASLRMVADGFADVASIDRVTYALIERYRPLALRKTRVLCCSVRTAAPPYVTGSQMTDKQVEQIRHALTETLAMPSMKVAMEALFLDGLANLPLEMYRPIGDLEQWALRMGITKSHGCPPRTCRRPAHSDLVFPLGAEQATDSHTGEPGTCEVTEDRTGNCACTVSDPAVTLPSQDGTPVSLKGFGGKWVVLYFYPKDMTQGCTIEAHNFQRDLAKYDQANAVILGVSVDSVDSHKQFCAKDSLTFKLLADTDKKVVDSHGSLRPNGMAARNTFLVDPTGKIAKVWTGVNPNAHSDEVLAALSNMK